MVKGWRRDDGGDGMRRPTDMERCGCNLLVHMLILLLLLMVMCYNIMPFMYLLTRPWCLHFSSCGSFSYSNLQCSSSSSSSQFLNHDQYFIELTSFLASSLVFSASFLFFFWASIDSYNYGHACMWPKFIVQ